MAILRGGGGRVREGKNFRGGERGFGDGVVLVTVGVVVLEVKFLVALEGIRFWYSFKEWRASERI